MRAKGRKIWEEALIGGPVASHFARIAYEFACTPAGALRPVIYCALPAVAFRHNEITNISHFSFLHLLDLHDYEVNNTSLDQLSTSSETKFEEGGTEHDSKS